MKLTELQPAAVFRWFERICAIPHGSGNTAALSEFCAAFAAQRGLACVRDEIGNVIIRKPASQGREQLAPVILQGHLDMVCDKRAGCPRDLRTEGIVPLTDGAYVFAEDTTLGADDGIALAYILAVLDDPEAVHPPLEVLLTVDEEVGMIGATALDCASLTGRRLINIDSEEEGVLTVGCAGGVRVNCTLRLSVTQPQQNAAFLRIAVSGLAGGHSGIEIGRHRGNAIVLLGRALHTLSQKCAFGICDVRGGAEMNIIPQQAEAVICTVDAAGAEAVIAEISAEFAAQFSVTEPQVCVTAEPCGAQPRCTDAASAAKLIFALMQTPNGMIEMHPEIPDMVMTSLNLGTAAFVGDVLALTYLVRSNDNRAKAALSEKLGAFYAYLGGSTAFSAGYPAWEYRSDSPLRSAMAETYQAMYGKTPLVQVIHAGLECGILSAKMDGADMVSIGPDIENAHTPNERLSAESARRCYEYLLSVLANLK